MSLTTTGRQRGQVQFHQTAETVLADGDLIFANGGTYPLLVSDFCRLAAQEVNLIPFLTRSKYVLLQGHSLMYQVNCLD